MVELGWTILGGMVRRRRHVLRWSQRDLAAVSLVAQSTISKLETGSLTGIRFRRFARLVAALGGLDPDAPHPPYPYRSRWS